ncbi:Protein YicC [hydrothermal vent metagenome]|uniref:Protein YicC n=1 Tax=hydrothermal vent metagenome TaxID=652676 RepID=A0A3B0XYX9_9ZZZZ
MTRSMTAFANCSDEQDWGTCVWEIRSVNHRYLDIQIKLPEELRSIENNIRNRFASHVKRGKLECVLRCKPSQNQQTEICVNEDYASAIIRACTSISKTLHQPSEMNAIEVLKWPGVVEASQVDFTQLARGALNLFDSALESLCETRQSEGVRLQQMLEERLLAMRQIVKGERQRRPQIVQQTRDKLIKKLEALNASYDKDRFEQEMVYLAQKMDVDEELDRLESHFTEIEDIFKRDEPVGRRLDFIMQEFNREANTLGAKSTDIETTQASVELKVLVEQMREQVQNIE